MSKKRRHIPGQTAHLVRRCRQGQFLLRPEDYTNAVVAYEMLYAAQRHGLEISGATSMSNHYHLMGLDTSGDRSDFMADFNRNITRRLKKHHNYQGSTWMPGKYVDVHIGNAKELDTLVYIWTNPVKDGLVESVDEWPGFQILPRHWGQEMTAKKPKAFYGKSGPEEITYTPKPPACLRHLPLEEARTLAQECLRAREKALVAQRKAKGKTFLGRQEVLDLDPKSTANSALNNRGPKNRFSFGSKSANAIAISTYKAFLDDYETQLQRWLIGQKAIFPCGTVKLRKQAPISCREIPTDQPGIYRPSSPQAANDSQSSPEPSSAPPTVATG